MDAIIWLQRKMLGNIAWRTLGAIVLLWIIVGIYAAIFATIVALGPSLLLMIAVPIEVALAIGTVALLLHVFGDGASIDGECQ